MNPAKGAAPKDVARRSGTPKNMETGKVVVAIVLLAAFFIFLPQILNSTFAGVGGVLFGAGSGGTLVLPEEGRGGVLAISYNGGELFEEAKVHTPWQPQIIDIDTHGKFYIAGTDRGLLISRDGGLNWHTFTDLEKHIDSNTVIYDFARSSAGALYVAAYKNAHGVIYVTNDQFFTATPIWTEAKMPVVAINADRGFLYAGLNDGRLLRYSFTKGTFEKLQNFDRGVRDLVFTGSGELFVGLDGGNIYSDGGTRTSFTKMQSPGDGFFVTQGGLHLTNDGRNSNSLFMASVSGIFGSKNGGSLWEEINSILPTRAQISVLVADSGSLFVTSEAKFYKSNDGGKTWKVSEPMPTTERFGTLYVSPGGKTIIVGTRK